MLTPLGGGRYALIVKENRKNDAHAAAGAVSVAYLQKRHAGWRKLGNWPEIAWAGQSGGDNLTVEVRHDLGRTPMLLVEGFYFGQDQLSASAVLVRLDADRPRALGSIPTAGDNTTGKFLSMRSYKYTSQIEGDRGPALLIVRYSGFTGPPGKPARTPFKITATVVLRDGCAVPATTVSLPDEPWTASDTADCAKG